MYFIRKKGNSCDSATRPSARSYSFNSREGGQDVNLGFCLLRKLGSPRHEDVDSALRSMRGFPASLALVALTSKNAYARKAAVEMIEDPGWLDAIARFDLEKMGLKEAYRDTSHLAIRRLSSLVILVNDPETLLLICREGTDEGRQEASGKLLSMLGVLSSGQLVSLYYSAPELAGREAVDRLFELQDSDGIRAVLSGLERRMRQSALARLGREMPWVLFGLVNENGCGILSVADGDGNTAQRPTHDALADEALHVFARMPDMLLGLCKASLQEEVNLKNSFAPLLASLADRIENRYLLAWLASQWNNAVPMAALWRLDGRDISLLARVAAREVPEGSLWSRPEGDPVALAAIRKMDIRPCMPESDIRAILRLHLDAGPQVRRALVEHVSSNLERLMDPRLLALVAREDPGNKSIEAAAMLCGMPVYYVPGAVRPDHLALLLGISEVRSFVPVERTLQARKEEVRALSVSGNQPAMRFLLRAGGEEDALEALEHIKTLNGSSERMRRYACRVLAGRIEAMMDRRLLAFMAEHSEDPHVRASARARYERRGSLLSRLGLRR
jgi:hypothetical protein